MDMNQEINTTLNTNAKHICSVDGYMDSSYHVAEGPSQPVHHFAVNTSTSVFMLLHAEVGTISGATFCPPLRSHSPLQQQGNLLQAVRSG